MEFKVHIFCGTTNLCRLMSKLCTKDSFSFCYSEIKDINSGNIFDDINYKPDCIIIDKDIDEELKEKVIKKFSLTKIVLLPSLNEVEQKKYSGYVSQISEPFKLSELEEVLKEIYHSKQSEEAIN
jgi:hypothetical protein